MIDRILGGPESPGRAELLAQVEVFTDPRIEGYWQLTDIVTGRGGPTRRSGGYRTRSQAPAQTSCRSLISVTLTIGKAGGERAFRACRFTLAGQGRWPAPPSTGAGAAAVVAVRSALGATIVLRSHR